jgi:hypothetical protein
MWLLRFKATLTAVESQFEPQECVQTAGQWGALCAMQPIFIIYISGDLAAHSHQHRGAKRRHLRNTNSRTSGPKKVKLKEDWRKLNKEALHSLWS